jgi:hypothetical protein
MKVLGGDLRAHRKQGPDKERVYGVRNNALLGKGG